MNILLVTGLFEELRVFLSQHPCDFLPRLRAHRSRLYPNLYATTSGPGLRKRKQLKKVLAEVRPGRIVNAGLVGILRPEDTCVAGDRLAIGGVKIAAGGLVYPGGPGRDLLLSVAAPVFHPAEKLELAIEHGARACDMEAGPLLSLASQIASWRPFDLQIVLCKVAGDLPSDFGLFAHEHRLRGWEGWGPARRLWTMLRFPGGPRQLVRLRGYRRAVLEALTVEIHRTLKPILDSGGSTDNNDSIFHPE